MKCLDYNCNEKITHDAYCPKCVNKMYEEIQELKDKLRRRNMQIKDLKAKYDKLFLAEFKIRNAFCNSSLSSKEFAGEVEKALNA